MSGVGGEGRGLTLSMRAEREMKGDESVDRGSFTPSRYTSSRGTSQVNGYTCYNYKRVTPYQKGTPHTSFGESGGAGNQHRYAHRNPSQAILGHPTQHLTNTQHPRIPSNLHRITLQHQGVHRQSQLSSCNKLGEKGFSGSRFRLGQRHTLQEQTTFREIWIPISHAKHCNVKY